MTADLMSALALLLGLLFLAGLAFLRGLLRHFLAFRPCFGQSDRDRLLAALDLLAGAPALQGAGLALLRRAADLGGSLLGIFASHERFSRVAGKISFKHEDGSRLRPAGVGAAGPDPAWEDG